MDPEAALAAAERAARRGEAREVVEKLANLCGWLAGGGFAPRNLDQRLAMLQDALEETR